RRHRLPERRSPHRATWFGCRWESRRSTTCSPTSTQRSASPFVHPVDLYFGGAEQAIGVYGVETDDGLALHDTGPTSTLGHLERGRADRALSLGDIRHLLLS